MTINTKTSSGFNNYHKIAICVPNFVVHEVRGQIPKRIYQASYLLPSDFPNNFLLTLLLCKYNERLLIWQKTNIEVSFKKTCMP